MIVLLKGSYYCNNLINLLTHVFQIEQLRHYHGDRFDLGQAEQFLLSLSDVPGYRHLIDTLLFKAEFLNKSPYLKSSFDTLTQACKDVRHNPGLRSFLTIVLHAGNFVNYVSRLFSLIVK